MNISLKFDLDITPFDIISNLPNFSALDSENPENTLETGENDEFDMEKGEQISPSQQSFLSGKNALVGRSVQKTNLTLVKCGLRCFVEREFYIPKHYSKRFQK